MERWGVINIKRGWLGNPVDGHFEGKIIELNEGWPQQTMLYYMMLQDPGLQGNDWTRVKTAMVSTAAWGFVRT